MEKWELAIKRLEVVKECLQTDTIDLKDVVEIILEHLLDLYYSQARQENIT